MIPGSRYLKPVAAFALLHAVFVLVGAYRCHSSSYRLPLNFKTKLSLSHRAQLSHSKIAEHNYSSQTRNLESLSFRSKNFILATALTSIRERNFDSLGGQEAVNVRKLLANVSLDESVMPQPVPPLLVGATTTLLICIAIALATRIPLMLSAFGKLVAKVFSTIAAFFKRINIGGSLSEVRYMFRLGLGSVQAWIDELRLAFHRAFGHRDIMLPSDDWSVCTLQERSRAGEGYLRYKFKLPEPACVLPLELGQEISICGLDAKGQVVSDSFIPLSPRRKQGFFEIVVSKSPAQQSAPNASLPKLLHSLALGDELAVRPGRTTLQYRGPSSPITDIVLVACGLGVVPMLQFVTELLPSRESSVRAASIVWLNEHADDFSLYNELEKAFYKYHRKLDVSCIIERDLFGNALMRNPRVHEAVPEFHIGTLAAVSGPDFFVHKVKEYLLRRGYPEDIVIAI